MSPLEPGRPLPMIVPEELDPVRPWRIEYDGRADVVSQRPGDVRPAVSVDIDDAWIGIDPLARELAGVEIEDFTRTYLPARPDVAVH